MTSIEKPAGKYFFPHSEYGKARQSAITVGTLWPPANMLASKRAELARRRQDRVTETASDNGRWLRLHQRVRVGGHAQDAEPHQKMVIACWEKDALSGRCAGRARR